MIVRIPIIRLIRLSSEMPRGPTFAVSGVFSQQDRRGHQALTSTHPLLLKRRFDLTGMIEDLIRNVQDDCGSAGSI